MKLLEENGRQGQAQDLSQLLFYMDGMSRQFDAVFQELQEVKAQLAQEKQPAVQKIMQGVVTNLENKVEWARDMLAGLRERITDCARNAAENFKEAGVSALDKAVSAMGVKNRLESLQEHISGVISDTKRSIEKVESIGHELRSVGGHLKNAGRAMTGKETQTVDGGQEGRFQSVVLAPMRATKSLLSNMNNATLAAIGRVENLELSAEAVREARAERQAEKKPSVRQMLTEKKAEAAARAAPALDKEHKAPEASL
ncbi:MAG: hypothetical protein K2L38_01860 [Dysosmobacter sp.]|nr:hypothetical protein [Dysosmobacter sp.]